MKADRVEVSHDERSNRWLIRIQVGAEVIRRYCDEAKDVDEATLRVLPSKQRRMKATRPMPRILSSCGK